MLQNLDSQSKPQANVAEQKQVGPQDSSTEQKQIGPQDSSTDLELAEINTRMAELKQRELILNDLSKKLSQKEAIQDAFESKYILSA